MLILLQIYPRFLNGYHSSHTARLFVFLSVYTLVSCKASWGIGISYRNKCCLFIKSACQGGETVPGNILRKINETETANTISHL